MYQTNIYDIMYEKYKIKKPIRLIECFAGVGSQAMALRDLNADFEQAQKHNSNTNLYKQAGNSIVKQVLMEIFKELL